MSERLYELIGKHQDEITTLREQVEKLTEECVVLRASNRTKLDTIAYLETREDENQQKVEKLTKERDKAVSTLNAAGYVDLGGELWKPPLGPSVAPLLEQLAAIAEQNEKLRDALDIAHAHADSLADSPGEMRFVNDVRLLPDLATPALNKYRAEGMRMAAEICEHISDEYREREGRRYPELKTDAETGASECESAIHARADELEKTNG